MVSWISLKPGWKLQDVQAGLNVIIAFLCAGAIFALVRYCWLLAARRVANKRDVPAYSLLSLNTIGETIDVVWLLRYDLFTAQYRSLLFQVVFVMLLTIATLMSGFIARFSTRNGTINTDRNVNGTFARREIGTITYAEADTNQTLAALQLAKFPQTKLLEYLPNLEYKWTYVEDQWNSSWSMNCKYSNSTEIPNPYATGNCTNGILSEFPQIYDNYKDWKQNYSRRTQSTGWRSNRDEYRNWLIFTHGMRYADHNKALDMWTGLEMRTVTIYLENIPYNTSAEDNGCNFGEGPIRRAFYTSCNCQLTRNTGNRDADDLYWGAYPDVDGVEYQVKAYIAHYGNRFMKESSGELPITVIEGEELAMFYQAYLITKDIVRAPFVERKINVQVRVAQVSFICLICCGAAALIVLLGLFHYWIFLFRHWHRLDKTPQSKLDWMLQTLRRENEETPNMKHRLSQAMTSGTTQAEDVPLNRLTNKDERKSLRSSVSASSMATPDIQRVDDSFETPVLGSDFSGRTPTMPSTWFPQQYERISPHARQGSWGSPYTSGGYNPGQQQSPLMWSGTQQVDTAYDPGRR